MGQLYLQKGKWNGRQLVPKEWVVQATSKQVDNADAPSAHNGPEWKEGYGFQFWRCRYNAFRADGSGGQYIVVMPDQDAVVAITAESGDLQGELDVIWKDLLPAFGAKALPANAAGQKSIAEAVSGLVAHPKKKP
jgi:CubicO group peptidase (beta-lactamase class C family)